MYAAEYLRQEGRKLAEAEFVSAAEHLRQEGRRLAEETALRQKAEAYGKLVKNLGDEKTAAKVLEISVAELRNVLAWKKENTK